MLVALLRLCWFRTVHWGIDPALGWMEVQSAVSQSLWRTVMKVGIDVSKLTFDVTWGNKESLQHRCFDYNEEGIKALLDLLPNDAHIVMEATGVYHSRLALRCYEADLKVSVVNPVAIKRFGQMLFKRAKSDKTDSALIHQFAESQNPDLWVPSSEAINELRQAIGWVDDLIRERTVANNREEAVRHNARPSQFVLGEIKDFRKYIKVRAKKCDQYLKAVVKKHFPELYNRLQTIPSVGEKTAIDMIVITEGFTKFTNDKALAAYVGVSPTTYSSGTSVHGRGGISRASKGRSRQYLYLCSWTARRINPGCAALYQRMSKAGKPPKVISIALAHKLLRQIFAVGMGSHDYQAESTYLT